MAAAAVLAAHLRQEQTARTVAIDEPVEDKDATASEADESPILTWSTGRVTLWLKRSGREQLAKVVAAADVDGATLVEMDGAAWEELGVKSALERAKIMAAVKKAAIEEPAAAGNIAPSVTKQDLHSKACHRHEKKMRKHFIDGLSPRTPDGGAEHTAGWMLCMANANRNPAEVKQHCLRFLGMYNVIDLLVFTIDMTYLVTADLSAKGPTGWCGVMVYTLIAMGAFGSGASMVSSTVLYNTVSTISDANMIVFCKLPSTIYFFKFINDYSIFSGFFTMSACFFVLYRVTVEIVLEGPAWRLYPGGPEFSPQWYYCVSIWLLPMLWMAKSLVPQAHGVVSSTHYAMYAGLMSSEPIAPLREDPTWAHRSSPEAIAEFVTKQGMAVGAATDPKQCEQQAAQRYAEQTTAAIADNGVAAEGLVGGAQGGDEAIWRLNTILSTMTARASDRFSSQLGTRKSAARVGLVPSV